MISSLAEPGRRFTTEGKAGINQGRRQRKQEEREGKTAINGLINANSNDWSVGYLRQNEKMGGENLYEAKEQNRRNPAHVIGQSFNRNRKRGGRGYGLSIGTQHV